MLAASTMSPFWTDCRLRRLLPAAAGILILAGPAALPAQPPPKRVTGAGEDCATPVIRVRAELVEIPVTITSHRGDFLRGLQRDNFRVLVNGVAQPIVYFAPVEELARIFLLVESSPAVFLIHTQHLLAAHQFLDGLAPADQVALATYDESLRPAMPFSSDKGAVYRALNAPRYSLGAARLNLYAGLAAVLDSLAAWPGKKSIVLLSTGLDTAGESRKHALFEKLRGLDVAIFSLALGGTLRDYSGDAGTSPAQRPASPGLSFAQVDQDLRTLAERTGGRAYFPRKAQDLPRIYRELAALLRNQYRLGIALAGRDGAFHRIEVQVRDARGRPLAAREGKSGYTITARPGYVAPAP